MDSTSTTYRWDRLSFGNPDYWEEIFASLHLELHGIHSQ